MSCGLLRQNTPLHKVNGGWPVLKRNRYPLSHKYSRLRTSSYIYLEEYLAGCENSGIRPFSKNAFIEEDFKGASLYLGGAMNLLF